MKNVDETIIYFLKGERYINIFETFYFKNDCKESSFIPVCLYL